MRIVKRMKVSNGIRQACECENEQSKGDIATFHRAMLSLVLRKTDDMISVYLLSPLQRHPIRENEEKLGETRERMLSFFHFTVDGWKHALPRVHMSQ